MYSRLILELTEEEGFRCELEKMFGEVLVLLDGRVHVYSIGFNVSQRIRVLIVCSIV